MRVFLDDEKLDWDHAWNLCEQTFGYTNHTLMPEALERWPVKLFEKMLPRHLMIIYEINHRFMRQVQTRWPGDMDRMRRMSIFEEGDGKNKQVRMAHLATVGSHSVNGVAALHTELIKSHLMPDFHQLWPERFNNKTNGVTPRRWVLYANPRLTRLITSRIGSEWIDRDLAQVKPLLAHADDPPLLERRCGRSSNRTSAIWPRWCSGAPASSCRPTRWWSSRSSASTSTSGSCWPACRSSRTTWRSSATPAPTRSPRAYIFAGKAAPGYAMAKLHIKLINDVAAVINADPEVRGRLAVVFLPNYGVSLAQALIPAADVSLQISTAGKEASGTSNMKFALNGALTVGTLDGANVEIREAVGPENFFLFGLTTPEVHALWASGYDPRAFIARSAALGEVLDLISGGFFSLGEIDRFKPIMDNLRNHDPFMVCADFDAYVAAEARAAQAFRDPRDWSRRALFNIVGAARFSSDETVRRYADEIWHIQPEKTDLASIGEP